MGEHQINVETTLCVSVLEFTRLNNVQSMVCISTLMCTLDNVENFLVNVISQQNDHFQKEEQQQQQESFQIEYTEFKVITAIS